MDAAAQAAVHRQLKNERNTRELTKFSGAEPWLINDWLTQFVAVAHANAWTEQNRLDRLPIYMVYYARDFYEQFHHDHPQATFAELRQALVDEFCGNDNGKVRQAEERIAALHYNPGDDLVANCQSVRLLCRKVNRTMPVVTRCLYRTSDLLLVVQTA